MWKSSEPRSINYHSNFYCSGGDTILFITYSSLVWPRPYCLSICAKVYFHCHARNVFLRTLRSEQTMVKLPQNYLGANDCLDLWNIDPYRMVSSIHSQASIWSRGTWLCNHNHIFHNASHDHHQHSFDKENKQMLILSNI